MTQGVFRTRTAVVLAVVSAMSLVGLGLLAIFGPELQPTRSGEADVYSMSAVGHGALLDTLEAMDVPATIHRNPKKTPLRERGVLLILEPDPHLVGDGNVDRPGLGELVARAPAALLALPKWQVRLEGQPYPRVNAVAPLESEDVLAPLKALGVHASLSRPRVAIQTSMRRNELGVAPRFPTQYRQYVQSAELEPLIADDFGILLGRMDHEGTTLYVLADPDLLANHGIHRGDNAKLVSTCLDWLRRDGAVVFDETLHGYPPRDESLLRALFRYPLVIALLHALVLVALVLWAGLGRFGDSPPPESGLEPGSGFLIRHTAWLLQFGRHSDTALRRYVDDTARDVAHRFHLPKKLTREQRDARLDELGASRGTTAQWTELRARVMQAIASRGPRREHAALQAAHALYAWKQEILDGPRSDSRTTTPVA